MIGGEAPLAPLASAVGGKSEQGCCSTSPPQGSSTVASSNEPVVVVCGKQVSPVAVAGGSPAVVDRRGPSIATSAAPPAESVLSQGTTTTSTTTSGGVLSQSGVWLSLLDSLKALQAENEEMLGQTTALLKKQKDQLEGLIAAQIKFTKYKNLTLQACVDFVKSQLIPNNKDQLVADGAVNLCGSTSSGITATVCVGRPDLTSEALNAYTHALGRLHNVDMTTPPHLSALSPAATAAPAAAPVTGPNSLHRLQQMLKTPASPPVSAKLNHDNTNNNNNGNTNNNNNGNTADAFKRKSLEPLSSSSVSPLQTLLAAACHLSADSHPTYRNGAAGSSAANIPVLQSLLGGASWKKTLELFNLARLHNDVDKTQPTGTGPTGTATVIGGTNASSGATLSRQQSTSPGSNFRRQNKSNNLPSCSPATITNTTRKIASTDHPPSSATNFNSDRSAYVERLVQSIFQQQTTASSTAGPNKAQPLFGRTTNNGSTTMAGVVDLAVDGIIVKPSPLATSNIPAAQDVRILTGAQADSLRQILAAEMLLHPNLLGRENHVFMDIFHENPSMMTAAGGAGAGGSGMPLKSKNSWLRIEVIEPNIFDHFTQRLLIDSERHCLAVIKSGLDWLEDRVKNSSFPAVAGYLRSIKIVLPTVAVADHPPPATIRFIQLSSPTAVGGGVTPPPVAGQETVAHKAWMGDQWTLINTGHNFMWKAEVLLSDECGSSANGTNNSVASLGLVPKRSSFQKSLRQSTYQNAQTEVLSWLIAKCETQKIKTFKYKSLKAEFTALIVSHEVPPTEAAGGVDSNSGGATWSRQSSSAVSSPFNCSSSVIGSDSGENRGKSRRNRKKGVVPAPNIETIAAPNTAAPAPAPAEPNLSVSAVEDNTEEEDDDESGNTGDRRLPSGRTVRTTGCRRNSSISSRSNRSYNSRQTASGGGRPAVTCGKRTKAETITAAAVGEDDDQSHNNSVDGFISEDETSGNRTTGGSKFTNSHYSAAAAKRRKHQADTPH